MTNIKIQSKLPSVGTNIFTVMSTLANEHNAINLSQGFPDFPSSERLNELVSYYMQKGFNQYAPMPGLPVFREQISHKISSLYDISIHPDEITVTAGATQALFTAIATFVRPGDEVVILEPAYDSYRPSIEVNGGIPVVYELKAPEYKVDWQAVQGLFSPKTRMIMINTPHNPTGTILNKEDLESLYNILKNTNIIVLSDEVYEHLIYDGESHQSVLRYPGLRERSLAVYSFGKTFHNTGWKLGYCVAPPALTAEFRKVHQFNVFSVNTPMQYALADFLQNPEEYLVLNNFFQEKRDYLVKVMEGSRLLPLPSKGTYFQLFDYSQISDEADRDFAKRMTIEFGVAAIPVSVFYSSKRDDKVIRLCFAKKEETLQKAGELLRTKIG
ncbi:MAG: aminotransferase class I/II-fold pyridoxal phosphate-dependent enzyme [Saprospiraceae bacterium]|nr:aminotransferase class I/II-fold pyridoxal phosphate-dependent enzyme [Saprospiraceae bacterium]